MGYVSYNLTETARAALLAKFPPKYNVVCHHVTVQPNVDETHPLPPLAVLEVVGYTSDGAGLEALIVTVDGKLERGCGSIYHITHSLVNGRSKVESNTVIEQYGWTPVDPPITIDALPAWND